MKNAFVEAFEKAKEVPYDPKWENGTGYLDGATIWVPAPDMSPFGTIYKSVDPDGRKILLIPIMKGRYGTHVIFERYAPDVNAPTSARPTYVHNASRATRAITPSGALSDEDLDRMIGTVVATDIEGARAIHGLCECVEAVLGSTRDIDRSIESALEMADDWGITEHAKPDVLENFLVQCGNYTGRYADAPETITIYDDEVQYTTWQLPLAIHELTIKLLRNATRITVG